MLSRIAWPVTQAVEFQLSFMSSSNMRCYKKKNILIGRFPMNHFLSYVKMAMNK